MPKNKTKNAEKEIKEIFPYATEKEEQEFLKFSDDENDDCQSNSEMELNSIDATRACDVALSDDDDDNFSENECENENENDESMDLGLNEDMDSNDSEIDQPLDRKTSREIGKVYAERNTRTVFVGNITPKVTRKVLQQLFNSKKVAGEGAVETIRIRGAISSEESCNAQSKRKAVILKSFAGGENQVLCAFVVLKKVEDVEKCLKLNNHVLDGKHIRVDRVKGKKMSFIPGNCVFVGNLPYSINEEIVREKFESCGEIINIRLIRSKKDGKPIGIGYVEFTESLGVDFALKLSGTLTIENRPLRIQKWSEESTQKGKRKAPIKQKKEIRKPKVVVPSNLKGIELKEFIQSKKKKLMKKAEKKREFVKKKQIKKPKSDK